MNYTDEELDNYEKYFASQQQSNYTDEELDNYEKYFASQQSVQQPIQQPVQQPIQQPVQQPLIQPQQVNNSLNNLQTQGSSTTQNNLNQQTQGLPLTPKPKREPVDIYNDLENIGKTDPATFQKMVSKLNDDEKTKIANYMIQKKQELGIQNDSSFLNNLKTGFGDFIQKTALAGEQLGANILPYSQETKDKLNQDIMYRKNMLDIDKQVNSSAGRTIGDIGGEIVTGIAGGSLAAKGIQKAGGKALEKVGEIGAKIASKAPTISKIAGAAGKGAIAGATGDLLTNPIDTNEGGYTSEKLKSAGEAATIGAATGAGLSVAGKAIGKGVEKIIKPLKEKGENTYLSKEAEKISKSIKNISVRNLIKNEDLDFLSKNNKVKELESINKNLEILDKTDDSDTLLDTVLKLDTAKKEIISNQKYNDRDKIAETIDKNILAKIDDLPTFKTSLNNMIESTTDKSKINKLESLKNILESKKPIDGSDREIDFLNKTKEIELKNIDDEIKSLKDQVKTNKMVINDDIKKSKIIDKIDELEYKKQDLLKKDELNIEKLDFKLDKNSENIFNSIKNIDKEIDNVKNIKIPQTKSIDDEIDKLKQLKQENKSKFNNEGFNKSIANIDKEIDNVKNVKIPATKSIDDELDKLKQLKQENKSKFNNEGFNKSIANIDDKITDILAGVKTSRTARQLKVLQEQKDKLIKNKSFKNNSNEIDLKIKELNKQKEEILLKNKVSVDEKKLAKLQEQKDILIKNSSFKNNSNEIDLKIKELNKQKEEILLKNKVSVDEKKLAKLQEQKDILSKKLNDNIKNYQLNKKGVDLNKNINLSNIDLKQNKLNKDLEYKKPSFDDELDFDIKNLENKKLKINTEFSNKLSEIQNKIDNNKGLNYQELIDFKKQVWNEYQKNPKDNYELKKLWKDLTDDTDKFLSKVSPEYAKLHKEATEYNFKNVQQAKFIKELTKEGKSSGLTKKIMNSPAKFEYIHKNLSEEGKNIFKQKTLENIFNKGKTKDGFDASKFLFEYKKFKETTDKKVFNQVFNVKEDNMFKDVFNFLKRVENKDTLKNINTKNNINEQIINVGVKSAKYGIPSLAHPGIGITLASYDLAKKGIEKIFENPDMIKKLTSDNVLAKKFMKLKNTKEGTPKWWADANLISSYIASTYKNED